MSLLGVPRDPCTCAGVGRPCAPCAAWEHGEVLAGGVVVCSVALWRKTWKCAVLLHELAVLERLPETQWRTVGRGWDE